VDKWNNITNSQNRVRKKSFGGTFCFSNCHIIRLDSLVFLVSGNGGNDRFCARLGILTIFKIAFFVYGNRN
jgi:hypothetical protein